MHISDRYLKKNPTSYIKVPKTFADTYSPKSWNIKKKKLYCKCGHLSEWGFRGWQKYKLFKLNQHLTLKNTPKMVYVSKGTKKNPLPSWECSILSRRFKLCLTLHIIRPHGAVCHHLQSRGNGREGGSGRQGGVREVERRANYTLEICSLKMVV